MGEVVNWQYSCQNLDMNATVPAGQPGLPEGWVEVVNNGYRYIFHSYQEAFDALQANTPYSPAATPRMTISVFTCDNPAGPDQGPHEGQNPLTTAWVEQGGVPEGWVRVTYADGSTKVFCGRTHAMQSM